MGESLAGRRQQKSWVPVGRHQQKSGESVGNRHQSQARRSQGATVFINYVSKRIHPKALGEVFEAYGRVVDVYIAYRNRKRIMKPHTFAFVRFSNSKEADKAINEGNNRRLDGFWVRVYHARNEKDDSHPLLNTSRKIRAPTVADGFRDGRSFSEVVLGKKDQSKPIFMPTESLKAKLCNEQLSNKVPIEMNPPQTETEWLKLCIVGQLKGMYNPDMVQQALRSEGYNCQICEWSGFYVLIKFESVECRDDFWKYKYSLLKLWFSDLEFLKEFERKRKLKVWLSFSGVPFSVWFESFFRNLASLWGEVIKIDEETVSKSRFDVGRVLVYIQALSDIPSAVSISVNGKLCHIRIAISEYEDEKTWIDNESSNDSMENVSDCSCDESQDEFNAEPFCGSENLAAQMAVQNHVVSNVADDKNGPISEFETANAITRDHSGLMQQTNGALGPSGDGVLMDVPINLAQESLNESSSQSGPPIPYFDCCSGLYTVFPKFSKRINGGFPQCMLTGKISGRSLSEPSHTGVRKENISRKNGNPSSRLPEHTSRTPTMGLSHSNNTDCIDKELTLLSEASQTIEVCNSLGLRFAANESEVTQKFIEISQKVEGVD